MTGILPFRDKFPELGEDVYIAPGAWVIGDVVIGDRSSIWFNTVVRGDVHYVRIGSETNIQDNSTLHVTRKKFPLEMGNRIVVGHRVILHGCVVEDDCLIGMGAVIMDGARIGSGSIIGAGSVVTPGMIVPPESLVLGTPAAVKRKVSDDEREQIKEGVSNYLEVTAFYLNPEPTFGAKKVKGFLG